MMLKTIAFSRELCDVAMQSIMTSPAGGGSLLQWQMQLLLR